MDSNKEMSKGAVLAELVKALLKSDITDPQANRREHEAFQNAFTKFDISPSDFWHHMVK